MRSALDVACGTGHSTAALAEHFPTVVGCDPSGAMLSLAHEDCSPAAFVSAEAEALPFSSRSFDLVTVSMALHWFDQVRFLSEANRVLAPGGELWAYNLFFPGVLVGGDAFANWHREVYLARYPSPPRRPTALAQLIEAAPGSLVFVEKLPLRFQVDFSADELRGYFTTQSNVEAALRQGATLNEVDTWLRNELAPFFRAERERFEYIGAVEIAAA